MLTPHTSRRIEAPWGLAIAGVALALVLGCRGSEAPTSVTPPVDNPEQTVEDGFASLGAFDVATDNDPGAQLFNDPALGQLLNSLGVSVFSKASGRVQRSAAGDMSLGRFALGGRKAMPSPRLGVTLAEGAGTYARDAQDVTEPFPGWVIVDAGNPPDGYVFQFDLDDDISFTNENGETVPVQGEFRLLEIAVDDGGTPEMPEDDFLTHVVTEIAASPDAGPVPTLARMELTATLTGETARIVIGDAQANDPNDANASFFGPMVVYFELAASQNTIDAVEQIYDSVERYGVRGESGLVFDTQTGTPDRASFVLAFGETTNPAAPPLRFALQLSNFRIENSAEVADVTGSITFNGAPVATLAGDTTEVPVDLDKNGEYDGSCVNVNISFADSPSESQNICEAVQSFDRELLPL